MMKGKKLLAGILSAAMVLGTMVVPVFADGDKTPTELFQDAFVAKESTITLAGDVTIDQSSAYSPVIVFDYDCTIDLAGYKLTKGSVTYIGVSRGANVTFKNGTINMGYVGDQTFLVTKGNLNFENITAEKSSSTGSWVVFADMQYLEGNSSINFDRCTMNLNGILAVAKGENNHNGYDRLINIKDTTMSTRNKTIYGGTTVLVSGNSNVSGSVYNVQNVYTIGDDASCPGATTLAATVTTTAGATSYYSTLAAAMTFAKDNEGAVIKLYKNEALGQTHFYNSIDLNGKTLTLNAGSNYIEKNITISNGNITVDGSTIADTVLNLFSWSGNAVNATFENVHITADDFSAACGLLGAYNTNKLTYKGGSITIGNNSGVGVDAIFNGGLGSCQGEFDIQNVEVNVNGNVEKVIFCSPNAVVNGLTFTGNVEKDTFSNVSGTIKNSTFTYTNTSAMRTIVNDAGFAKELNFENVKFYDVPECTYGVFKLTANSIVKADENTEIETTQKAFEAKVGNTYYSTFAAALKAAQTGNTITLVSDVTFTHTSTEALTNASVIELNRKVLTLDGVDYNFGNITIQNGYIDVTTETAPNSQGIFCAWEGNESIVFDGVTITANKLNDELLSLISYGKGKVTLKGNSTIKVTPETTTDFAAIIAADENVAGVEIIDSTIEASNTKAKILLWGNVKISGNSTIKGNVLGEGMRFGAYDGDSLTITKTRTGTPNINITTPASRYGIYFSRGDVPYTVDDDIDVKATIYRPATAATLANTVKVSFADVTENEGEAVYDIYVEADSEKTINRLTAIQMALNLTSNDDFEMTVTPAEGVTRSFEDGMYLFNFDGETRPSATGTKIKIGQVKFVGYGTFTLAIDDTKDNKAHATTNEGENLVTDFVKVPNDGQGTFDISANLNGVEVKRPTRKLTINIDFNNSVENQAVAYQDMTVTVTGSDGTNKVFNLGNGGTDIDTDTNKATIVIDDLTYTSTYSVEVKGAGYRTAYYPTVNMNDDKTLNFWNNYKDTAVAVEVGKDASAKNATFLASEIVKDGKINIYDLSAVVSYFGMKELTTSADYAKYAKYDLNRDGKIDSRDVAYVLVSWGR